MAKDRKVKPKDAKAKKSKKAGENGKARKTKAMHWSDARLKTDVRPLFERG
jgi:hypothetical protein